jgi:hypothetical protein
MKFVTKSGTVVETLELAGRSTPFLLSDRKNGSVGYHIKLAVDGKPCPPFWIDRNTFEHEIRTMDENDFWELRAADAFTHLQVFEHRGKQSAGPGSVAFAGDLIPDKGGLL